MSNYFTNFPKTLYLFGDEITPTAIQNISKFTNTIDQIADQISAYIEYEIRDFERPDTLSHRLYGTSEYDWTFFVMNDALRERGWPLPLQNIYDMAEKDLYTGWTSKIEFGFNTVDSAASWALDKTTNPSTELYPVGQEVLLNGKPMIVKNKNLQVGEITFYSPYYNIDRDSDYSTSTQVSYPSGAHTKMLSSTVREYFGTYEYRNDSDLPIDLYFGEWNNSTQTYVIPANKTQVTNLDHLIEENDGLKRIRIIKANLIAQVAGKFKAAIG